MDSFEYDKKEKLGCGWVLAGKNYESFPITLKIVKSGWWDKDIQGKDKNHSKDLVIVEIPELKEIPGIPFGKDGSIKVGGGVYHVGFPSRRLPYVDFDHRANSPLVSQGAVRELSSTNGIGDFIGVNGTSGGPVVNDQGELVGIFWGKKENARDAQLFRLDRERPKIEAPETSYFIPLQWVVDAAK